MRVNAYRIVKELRVEELEESDLVSISEAAKIAGLTTSGISRALDKGKLPEYLLLPRIDDRIQRFTSRKALAEMAKEKPTARKTAKSRLLSRPIG